MTTPPPIPIQLIGGDPPALVEAVVRSWRDHPAWRGVAVLELAPVPPTPARLLRQGGGCICCVPRPALATALRDLLLERFRGLRTVDSVALASPGLPRPRALAQTLAADPLLRQAFSAAGTTVIVSNAEPEPFAADPETPDVLAAARLVVVTDLAGAPPPP